MRDHDPYFDGPAPKPAPNRLSPEERYVRDPVFHHLVEVLEQAIRSANYTPTEVREAAMLACIRHEQSTARPPIDYVERAYRWADESRRDADRS